jgi:SH3-like domain-containing protein
VNARRGPGDDYPLLWVYHAKDLPVQIVAETEDWRRICDPEGGLAWVHRRTMDARRTVMRVRSEPLPMRRKPDDDAGAGPSLAGRAIADLKDCKGDWCKIAVGHTSGWVHAGEVWGATETPQCTGEKPHG